MATANAALDRFVLRVRELYSLPAVAVKVLELTSLPQVDVRALRACIENDPALCAKILRVVNSSLFGLSREARDLGQALAHLGIKPLKLLVLGFSLSERLCTHAQGEATARYWRHALTQAVAAREITERIANLPGDEAFLAGLLENVGMLVLLQELGEPYARFLNRAIAAAREVAPLEAGSLGFSHRDLSVRLLQLWHMPAAMVNVVEHAAPGRAIDAIDPDQQVLVRTLRVSRLVADLVVDRQHSLLERLLHEPAVDGPLSRGQIDNLMATLESKVTQLAEMLAFELPTGGTDYRDVLVEAHTRLARLASDIAGDMVTAARSAEFGLPERELFEDTVDLARVMSAACRTTSGCPADLPDAQAPARVAMANASLAAAAATPVVAARPAAAKSVPSVAARRTDFSRTLNEQLTTALDASRASHAPLSLVLVAIDRYEELARDAGTIASEQLLYDVECLCRSCDVPDAGCVPGAPGSFGLVLPVCDRAEAVEQADGLLTGFRKTRRASQAVREPSISIGVATAASPSKNFRIDDLLASARRCLSAAQLAGGNTLKSIGVY